MGELVGFGLVFLALLSIVGFFFRSRWIEIASNRDLWRSHEINSYSITIRHGSRLLVDKFDSEALGSGTVLTVVKEELAQVNGPYSQEMPLEDFYPYTVEGLFDKALFYWYIQYDPVYGFPLRMGGGRSWAIEVTNFQPLPSR